MQTETNDSGDVASTSQTATDYFKQGYCIATTMRGFNNRRRKQKVLEQNAHLFALDTVPANGDDPNDDSTDDDTDSEPDNYYKKAKIEMSIEEYGDVD